MSGDGRIRCAFETQGLAYDLLRTGYVRPSIARYTPESVRRHRHFILVHANELLRTVEPESLVEELYIRLLQREIKKEFHRRWKAFFKC